MYLGSIGRIEVDIFDLDLWPWELQLMAAWRVYFLLPFNTV